MIIKPDKRPVFLNLFKIGFPVTAVQSIMHRVFGVCMVFALPFTIYLFGLSLESSEGFERVGDILSCTLTKLIAAALVWGLAHHFFAGVRFLLIDIEIGITRESARFSSWLVIAAGVVVLLLFLGAVL